MFIARKNLQSPSDIMIPHTPWPNSEKAHFKAKFQSLHTRGLQITVNTLPDLIGQLTSFFNLGNPVPNDVLEVFRIYIFPSPLFFNDSKHFPGILELITCMIDQF